jgi:glycosyltransferase involved in cell wall biosynthesis
MKIGLVGYNCNTGLGEVNRQIAKYGRVDKWLIKPHRKPLNQEIILGVEETYCPAYDTPKIREFVKSVDCLLFVETPYYDNLIEIAKEEKKRLVCIPMQEWFPTELGSWTNQLDLVICPNQYSYDLFSSTFNCVKFPWPIDLAKFRYVPRTLCNRFLFLNGNGGFKGRKGLETLKESLRIWPEMPVIVRSQVDTFLGSKYLLSGELSSNVELYRDGDVLICPHYTDGLALEPMEAAACGVPTIITDGDVWKDIPRLASIQATKSQGRTNKITNWYIVDPYDLVKVCKELQGTEIAQASQKVRLWAEQRQWCSSLSDLFYYLVTEGATDSSLNTNYFKSTKGYAK